MREASCRWHFQPSTTAGTSASTTFFCLRKNRSLRTHPRMLIFLFKTRPSSQNKAHYIIMPNLRFSQVEKQKRKGKKSLALKND